MRRRNTFVDLGRAALLAWLIPGATSALGAELAPGSWGKRAELIEANSEFAVAETGGTIYVLGGYPANRQSVTTVQIYDTKSDTWRLGPPLPQPNNHGIAAAVEGVIYLIGGQTDPATAYVDTVYALDPKIGRWVEKAPMPSKRSAGVALVLGGKIYVAGGRPPRGNDFAVYDPAVDRWETLPPLPSQRNHTAGAVIGSRMLVVGGRLGGGFQSELTAVTEYFDPASRTWTSGAALPRPRSGINGAMAFGCFHVWGGEHTTGVFPDHDVYDPRAGRWTKLPDMPLPVHGVTGAAFVDGLIRVVGGGTSQGGSSGSKLNQVYRPAIRCDQ